MENNDDEPNYDHLFGAFMPFEYAIGLIIIEDTSSNGQTQHRVVPFTMELAMQPTTGQKYN